MNKLGDLYREDCDIATIASDDQPYVGVKDYAIDPEQAARLWDLSIQLIGRQDIRY